ncbi:MAG TPA: DNA alkylation repair protein [Bacillales bacterium]|nr:DNA alkylation repair protein [Bacillales bacterium]
MGEPYLCPSCNSNRTWFNKIEQLDTTVKMDPQTGEVVEEFSDSSLPPFVFPYKGAQYKIQCGICGLIGDENQFIKNAQHQSKTVRSS